MTDFRNLQGVHLLRHTRPGEVNGEDGPTDPFHLAQAAFSNLANRIFAIEDPAEQRLHYIQLVDGRAFGIDQLLALRAAGGLD